jgi:hypothetical protein
MFNGLNIPLVPDTGQLPKMIADMGVSSNFINNCNIMLVVFYVYFFFTGLLCIMGKLLAKPTLLKYAIRALKQGMLTLVLFNCFNFSFSAGVHWKYSNPTDDYHV